MIKIGIFGKTNTGKTTFFNVATLQSGKVLPSPFTTKNPVYGISNISSACVCKELGVRDDPRNSLCIDNVRYVPFELVDLPGLIKGSWSGKGIGNEFLHVFSRLDALIHIVDVSGSVDIEGGISDSFDNDPITDYFDIENELVVWYMKDMLRSKNHMMKINKNTEKTTDVLMEIFKEKKINKEEIKKTLDVTKLREKEIIKWDYNDQEKFSFYLRHISKPTIIIANKMDIGNADQNFMQMKKKLGDIKIFSMTETETLKEKVDGDTQKQTDVQSALNHLILKILDYRIVYPIEKMDTLTDNQNRVLPDALLMRRGSTLKDLAEKIHSELAGECLYGINARTGVHLPNNYQIQDKDVLMLVTS